MRRATGACRGGAGRAAGVARSPGVTTPFLVLVRVEPAALARDTAVPQSEPRLTDGRRPKRASVIACLARARARKTGARPAIIRRVPVRRSRLPLPVPTLQGAIPVGIYEGEPSC